CVRLGEPHSGMNARPALDRVEVVALDVSAPDWTRLGARVQGTRDLHVDGVNSLSCDLRRHVEVLALRSHQRELVSALDLDGRGMRMLKLRRARRYLAISHSSSGSRVRDDAV